MLALLAGMFIELSHDLWAADQQEDVRGIFETVGKMYQIDPALLAAIAEVESGGDERAVSSKGAAGLMQLMPDTAHRFHVSDPYDAVESVLAAAKLLTSLRIRFRGRAFDLSVLPEVIAAYNAGERAVIVHAGVPPYPETREYVRKVLWIYLTRTIPRCPLHRIPRTDRSSSGEDMLLQHLSRIRDARARQQQRGSARRR